MYSRRPSAGKEEVLPAPWFSWLIVRGALPFYNTNAIPPYYQGPRGRTMVHAVDKFGDVAVITVNMDQLDAGNADDFREDLAPVLDQNHKLVLDLGRLRFIDSRGCGVIISCLKHATSAGGDLKLCQVQAPVRTVFELIRLHRICEIVNTREDAVREFQSPRKG
jgi:anti-sigma B factor antagonist